MLGDKIWFTPHPYIFILATTWHVNVRLLLRLIRVFFCLFTLIRTEAKEPERQFLVVSQFLQVHPKRLIKITFCKLMGNKWVRLTHALSKTFGVEVSQAWPAGPEEETKRKSYYHIFGILWSITLMTRNLVIICAYKTQGGRWVFGINRLKKKKIPNSL